MAGGFAKPVYHTGGYLEGRALVWPVSLIISLFFLWGFSYGLLDVLNSHFQTVLGITKLQSTGLQIAYFGGGYFIYSPIAGEIMRRRGYKPTIIMGLSLYSLGAIFFWPVAHFTTPQNAKACFGGFVVCTFVIACGLASLEVAANSYATVIGNPRTAARRLQFCQAWNGVASFIGPLIASHAFFSGSNLNNLTNVQFVYLAVSIAGLLVNILFITTNMPEVSEEVLQAMAAAEESEAGTGTDRPFWRQWNCIFGFVAQFAYVGAQVTVASFFINYVNENGGLSKSRASLLLSMSLLLFTVGRFVGTALLTWIKADFLMIIYACACTALCGAASGVKGTPAVGCIMTLFFFESIMYPVIFVIGTEKLGRHTRRGSSLIVMGVAGGAVFPPIQGAIADAANTRVSYVAPTVGYVIVLGYVLVHWARAGFEIMVPVQTVASADEAVLDGAVHTSSMGGVIGQPLTQVRTVESAGKGSAEKV